MPRTRIISSTEALFCGGAPSTGTGLPITQLHRVQSVAHNWSIGRQNITQFGQLSPISREITTTPTVSLDFSYYLTNFLNEHNLGFVTDGSASAISGFLNETTDDRNYYLLETPEGTDAVGYSGPGSVVYGIGNGFMSSYSTEARVNGFPTATVRVEGLNMVAYAATSGQSPALNPENGSRIVDNFSLPTATSGLVGQATVLRHGDITMNLGSSVIGVNLTDAKIQRYTLSFNLRRTAQERIGSRFSFARTLEFPVEVTLSVEANLGDLATGSVADMFCQDVPYTLGVNLSKPACTGSGPLAATFTLYGAKLDSANFNSTIGPNKTVTIQWSTFLGGPTDTGVGVFMSGILT